jgi:hypothetical protein
VLEKKKKKRQEIIPYGREEAKARKSKEKEKEKEKMELKHKEQCKRPTKPKKLLVIIFLLCVSPYF